jgi:hypothetical protein
MKSITTDASPSTSFSGDPDKGHTAKVSFDLTEQVKQAVSARYKGVKLTKRTALEIALAEWLDEETRSVKNNADAT